MKVMMVAAGEDSSSEEPDDPPPPPKKKRKAHVRQTKAAVRAPDPPASHPDTAVDRRPNETNRCFACGRAGHFAKECTDPAAKARKEAYLAERKLKQTPAENGDRAYTTSGAVGDSPDDGGKRSERDADTGRGR
ncbi:hypothetical protein PR003_g13474 [Phytophthora rubi]|uniref:CCHC-type domain-containing protein n=1 Tax=Phytophthora rubi TaxID=129364 RepID=A0A6A4EXE6_9STRA|nr:hypothetical protein PR003_g13474 [Phytophthora rubi]